MRLGKNKGSLLRGVGVGLWGFSVVSLACIGDAGLRMASSTSWATSLSLWCASELSNHNQLFSLSVLMIWQSVGEDILHLLDITGKLTLLLVK